jgi:hypothetical protein
MNKYSLTSDVIEGLVNKMNKGKPARSEALTPKFNSDISHILVVFTGTNFNLKESLIELMNAKKNYGFSYDVGFSFSGAMVMGEKGIEDIIKSLNPRNVYYEEDQLLFEKILSSVEGAIVPMATQDTVAKLALGIQDCFISTLLWQAIWRGKSVLIDFKDVVRYKGEKSKSAGQQRIMDRHIAEVIELGAVEVEAGDYIVGMLNEFKNVKIELEPSKNSNSVDRTVNKSVDIPAILTSRDLLKLVGDKKSLKVPSTTIVTPLAIDTAKENGIQIIKQ